METMTPGEVAEHLQVSAPTVRRMAGAYELVFGPLDRDSRGHRLWSLDAVRRVQVAHAALNTGKVTSLEAALQMVRDGLDLPVSTVLPIQHGVLAELLAEVRGLRALAEAQGRELVALRLVLAAERVLPACTPAVALERVRQIDLAPDEQSDAQPERLAERSTVAVPAVSLLVRTLLRLIGWRR